MSPDLGPAMRRAVDDGPHDAPFDVELLTRRIGLRRRRRAIVRATSAVGAVALVALAVTAVADHARTSGDVGRTVRVACGSRVADIPVEVAPSIGVARGAPTDFDNVPAPPPPPGTSLGRVDVGSPTSVQVVTTITDAELAAMPQASVDEAHQMLVRWRTTLTAEKAQRPVDQAAVRMTRASIAWLEPTIRHVDEVRDQAPAGAVRAAGELLLVQDGRVVATDPVPPLTADALLSPDRTATTEVPVALRGCADGAGALPAGDYRVYVTDPGSVGPAAVGPWTITVR